MLSLIKLMGFVTLLAMEPRHQAGWSTSSAPAISPLVCLHQHLVISLFNFSPAFSSVLSSCQAPLSFHFLKNLIYPHSFSYGFECYSFPQAFSFTARLIHQLSLRTPGHCASILDSRVFILNIRLCYKVGEI